MNEVENKKNENAVNVNGAQEIVEKAVGEEASVCVEEVMNGQDTTMYDFNLSAKKNKAGEGQDVMIESDGYDNDGQTDAISESGLTEEERRVLHDYALNNADIKRAIVAEYLLTLKSESEKSPPPVLTGGSGSSVFVAPKTPRSLFEAGRIAETYIRERR